METVSINSAHKTSRNSANALKVLKSDLRFQWDYITLNAYELYHIISFVASENCIEIAKIGKIYNVLIIHIEECGFRDGGNFIDYFTKFYDVQVLLAQIS